MDGHRETAVLAERLIGETCEKQGIQPGQLTLHADRGTSMRSKPVALLLADLGVVKTHSRPQVSNDNPFSESQFKTMKYRPEFPDRFGSIQHTRAFGHVFFPWYNDEHHHSALGFLTPAVVHYGLADAVRQQRKEVLKAAYSAHPERFVRGTPEPAALPQAVWINPPEKTGLHDAPQSTIVTADDLRVDQTPPIYDHSGSRTVITSTLVSQCH
jgi:putative transposase